ncbi:hypothetical protein O6H91_Y020900 [Diphasiastrum complanatum]|nr:hypothetical protein O6H91_Y020900 [Diphasiastrum complanatum]KAJ7298033.1 hypothetical protein O6H91_Y020900 [Diphasiastrum complanatum]
MGQTISCRDAHAQQLYEAVLDGDTFVVAGLIAKEPQLVNRTAHYRQLAPLHLAASNSQFDVMNILLQQGANVNAISHIGQTPLMLACKAGSLACVQQLLEHGANVLSFDTSYSRTPLHYAAKGGHTECVKRLLIAAQTGTVNDSWYINVRDAKGTTPLHLAARRGHLAVLKVLLDNGALVSAIASTTGNGPGRGSTPLHCAARKGSPECIQELIAWGSDRTHRNLTGHTAYKIAIKYKNMACAALLNPNIAEPLVWPSPWKFMKELNPEARTLLEAALAQANQVREVADSFQIEENDAISSALSPKRDKAHNVERSKSQKSEEQEMVTGEVCCICFEKFCTIEMQGCGHQMCAACTIALCCHNKPNPVMHHSPPPACPFCRCNIEQLTVAKPGIKSFEKETRSRHRRFKRSSSGKKCSCDSGEGSLTILSGGKGSGKISDIDWLTKQSCEPPSTEICVS